MLVCNVSLRPPRTAIAADIAESAVAADATATGNIVFATLVDDPASVGDFVDAYSGEIMLEAASAAATADAGLVYLVGVDEGITAIAAQDGAVGTIVVGTAVTTTGAGGPLFMFDTTFPSSSLTVINAGR